MGNAIKNDKRDTLSITPLLTEKEKEVCRLMIRGYGNKEIAQLNGSAPATVKLHRSRVLEKMGCEILPELIDMTREDHQNIMS